MENKVKKKEDMISLDEAVETNMLIVVYLDTLLKYLTYKWVLSFNMCSAFTKIFS